MFMLTSYILVQAAQGPVSILRRGCFLSVAVSVGEGLESWCKLELSSRQEKQRWRGFQLCYTGGMNLFFACYYTVLTSYGMHYEICLELFVWSQSSGTHFWVSIVSSVIISHKVSVHWEVCAYHKCNNVRSVRLYPHWNLIEKCFNVILQVMEETGFDIAPKLRLDDHLEVLIGQQRMRLYIIPGVRDDTRFAPLTKKEISVCLINQDMGCWSSLMFGSLKYMAYIWLLRMPPDIL